MQKSIVKDQSFKLSILGVKLFVQMKQQKEFVLSQQFLKSVTSIGANIHEALAAESRKDFIHKLSISLKEARETEYWIQLIKQTNLVEIQVDNFYIELSSVTAMLVSIIKTSKRNLNNSTN